MTELSPTKKQMLRFLVVGCSAVATDFLSYTALLSWFDWGYTPAKATSFILGTVVAFIFNKYWTFNQPEYRHAEVGKFIVLYTTTLGANVAVNHLALLIFPSLVLFAFLAATGTSTVLNFIGQKWWVFTDKN